MNKMKTKFLAYSAAVITCGFMGCAFADNNTPPSLSTCMSSTTPSVLDACIQNNVCYQYNNGNNGDIQGCISSLAFQDYVANFSAATPADPNANSSTSSSNAPSSSNSSGSSTQGSNNSGSSSGTNPANTSNGSSPTNPASTSATGGSNIKWF